MDLPTADAGSDLWICPGGSMFLSASGGVQYSWSPDSTLDVNNTFNPLASPIDDETYFVTVTDSNNCVNSDSVFLKVNRNVPTDWRYISNLWFFCSCFRTVPTSPNGSTYQWTSSSTITGATSANPTSQPFTPDWFVVETANDTCTGIDSVFVDFFGDFIASSSNDTSICFGESTLISATAGYSYLWSPW